mgnify:CR=1 FL=1
MPGPIALACRCRCRRNSRHRPWPPRCPLRFHTPPTSLCSEWSFNCGAFSGEGGVVIFAVLISALCMFTLGVYFLLLAFAQRQLARRPYMLYRHNNVLLRVQARLAGGRGLVSWSHRVSCAVHAVPYKSATAHAGQMKRTPSPPARAQRDPACTQGPPPPAVPDAPHRRRLLLRLQHTILVCVLVGAQAAAAAALHATMPDSPPSLLSGNAREQPVLHHAFCNTVLGTHPLPLRRPQVRQPAELHQLHPDVAWADADAGREGCRGAVEACCRL